MNEISLEDIKKALQELLVDGLLDDGIKDQTAILKEDDICAKLKEVKIIKVPDNSILIKMDYGNANDIFRSEKGQRRRCDYLLITDRSNKRNRGNKKILLFVELKSKTFSDIAIAQKFHASECLFDYILSMLNHFHKIDFELGECKKRFVLFHQMHINKNPVHPTKKNGKTQVQIQRSGLIPEDYLSIKFSPNEPPTLKSLS
ncbi:MAG: hypothetical protein LBK06_02215 [Planctomycetaceae bacterium]|jgi:hypothetical protein|nr:hypothetical protein [Planctomycetaceae bacterium]